MELTSGQKKVLELLAKSPLKSKFYWTGGTLLAYHYFKHRKSEDLDFFSAEEFSFDEINQFIQRLRTNAGFNDVQYQKIFDRHIFLLKNGEVLKIEFVHYNCKKTPFSQNGVPLTGNYTLPRPSGGNEERVSLQVCKLVEKTADFQSAEVYNHGRKQLGEKVKILGILSDSLKDIAANKTLAYFDRNEPKDVFDIYFLITKGKFTPWQLLNLVNEKFGVKLPESLFWSESFKKIKSLFTLKPFLLEKNASKEWDLLTKIEDFFKSKSGEFLRKDLS